jgi:hypothetical protein
LRFYADADAIALFSADRANTDDNPNAVVVSYCALRIAVFSSAAFLFLLAHQQAKSIARLLE